MGSWRGRWIASLRSQLSVGDVVGRGALGFLQHRAAGHAVAVGEGFGDVVALDGVGAGEVGDGAADALGAGEAAGGKAEFGGGHFEKRFRVGGEDDEVGQRFGVGCGAVFAVAGALAGASGGDAGGDRAGGLAGRGPGEFFRAEG